MTFFDLLKPQAYLDPGSGSVLLQVLLAALLGAGFMIRMFWKKILGFFGRAPKADEQEADDDAE